MKSPEPTEHAEQCAVITWAALNAAKWPCLRLLYAVPNGAFFGGEVKKLKNGKNLPVSAIRARKLKAEGLKEGVPDLCLPVPSLVVRASARSESESRPPKGGTTNPEPCHGLYIELKRRTQGRASEMQKWWHQCLIAQGYRVELCRGAAEAIEVLRQHVKGAIENRLPPLPVVKQKKPGRARPDGLKPELRAKKPLPFLYPGRP